MIGTITLKVHGKDKPFPVKDGKVDHKDVKMMLGLGKGEV